MTGTMMFIWVDSTPLVFLVEFGLALSNLHRINIYTQGLGSHRIDIYTEKLGSTQILLRRCWIGAYTVVA